MFKLLPWKNNTMIGIVKVMSVVMSCLAITLAHANERAFQVHGFIAQGLIQAKHSNFVNDSGDLSAELTEIGLNASYQISDDLRLTAQAVYLNGGNRYETGVRVDYALLDWDVFTNENWQVNAYLGRFKNNHWLYSSVRNVPMIRPSIILPQSVYFDGTRDMSVGGDGLSLTVKHSTEQNGDIDINLSSGKTVVSNEQTKLIMGQYTEGKLTHANDVQASLYWQPFMSLWRFGLAYTGANFTYKSDISADVAKNFAVIVRYDGVIRLNRFYANASYQTEFWTISAELLQEGMDVEGLVYHPQFALEKVGQGGYLQGELSITNKLKGLLRYERFYADKNDKLGKRLAEETIIPEFFAYQNDTTLSFTYDLSANSSLQFEHHWIQGTARLTPIVIPNPLVNNHKNWQLSAIQLTYWF